MNPRPLIFWFLGGVLILFGAMIAGQARLGDLGVTPASYALAMVVAFICILIGGLFWISVAAIIHEEF